MDKVQENSVKMARDWLTGDGKYFHG